MPSGQEASPVLSEVIEQITYPLFLRRLDERRNESVPDRGTDNPRPENRPAASSVRFHLPIDNNRYVPSAFQKLHHLLAFACHLRPS